MPAAAWAAMLTLHVYSTEPSAIGSVFAVETTLTAAASTPGEGTAVQVAVLVFLNSQAAPPSEAEHLADTGASYAFVTQQLIVLTD